ncbi:hypothetical protein [Arthrobacter sp. UYCu712]|uniref:hypothetical protein n=1 Tax=Arthrobacter sp. UYCu712 TaxID=3156340 RepID=UPI003398560C
MGTTISFPEAEHLIDGLALEMDSHFVMSVQGWKYPMGRHALYAAATLARVVAVTRGKGEQPLDLDLPWATAGDNSDVTPEERKALTEQLRARSAFGQKRTEAPSV